MLCFRKFPVAKKFMDKRGGEYQDFPLIFFVSQCRKVSQGNPLGCHYFRVSKKFMLQRVISRFSVEIFCLTVTKGS